MNMMARSRASFIEKEPCEARSSTARSRQSRQLHTLRSKTKVDNVGGTRTGDVFFAKLLRALQPGFSSSAMRAGISQRTNNVGTVYIFRIASKAINHQSGCAFEIASSGLAGANFAWNSDLLPICSLQRRRSRGRLWGLCQSLSASAAEDG